MKCDHEFGPYIKVYVKSLPSEGYINSKTIAGIPIVGPQACYQRRCSKCQIIDLVCGTLCEEYISICCVLDLG